MPKKKKAGNKQTTIKVGDISDISGNMSIAGGNISTIQQIDTVESGASVVGNIAAGKSSINVGGQQQYGDTVQNKQEVNTSGGAYIAGGVDTGGGDFVGRDQNVQGDMEHGSQIGGAPSSADKISGGQGVAIGQDAQAMTTGLTGQIIESLFAPLVAAVHLAAPYNRDEALQKVAALKVEVAKGNRADDSQMARQLDRLMVLAPGAASAAADIFTSPTLAGVAGPVTKFVVDRIQGK